VNVEEQRHYHDLGASYFWFSGKRRLAFALLDQQTKGAPWGEGCRVLDAGCGPGHDLEDLRRFGTVYGLDYSLEALGLCRQLCRDRDQLICASGEQLPFQPGSFDLLVMFDVLEHVAQDGKMLQGCRRVLNSNGRLLLSVPAFQWLWGFHDERYGHRRRYTVPEIRSKLEQAGFVVDRAAYIEWIYTLPLFVMRRLKRWLPGTARRDDFIRIPRWLNAALTATITMELAWLRRGSPPWGVSILCIAHPAG
jgi:SAM-dependent methyltransferase